MPLADGDYIKAEEYIVNTLKADTGSGGLVEAGDPPVKLIEAEIRDEVEAYAKQEFPVIAVTIVSKSEGPDPTEEVMAKNFEVHFLIFTSQATREGADSECKKVAARLEKVVRDQTGTSKHFLGLPAEIDGNDNTLLSGITDTNFYTGQSEGRKVPKWFCLGLVEALVYVPVAFDFE
jgi:hypothetical protein